MQFRHLLISSLVCVAACEAPPDTSTRALVANQQALYRGHLILGHEARTFTGCDTRREAWVVDETGGELVRAYEALSSEPYQPIFVEVSAFRRAAPETGFGADFDEAIEVAEVLRAENEGFGCDLDTARFAFVASGNEPSWRLDVDKLGMHFRTPVRQLDSDWLEAARGPGISIRISGAMADMPIDLVLEEKRCTDSMSGAWYSYSAAATVGTVSYSGCAIEGLMPLN